jgi:hypothetical protein
MSRLVLVLALLVCPAMAFASSVTLTGGGGETQNAPGDPNTNSATASAAASIDVIEPLSIDFSLAYMHDFGTPPAPGTDFGDTGENTYVLDLGTTWTPNDHWTLDEAFSWSPKSPSAADTTLTFDREVGRSEKTTNLQGFLRSTAATIGGNIGVDYDTAGDSNFESDVTLELADSELTVNQNLEEIYEDGVKVNADDLKTYCDNAGRGTLRCKQLQPALEDSTVMLNTFSIKAGFTETLFDNTDLSVGVTYYIYSQDPTTLGYFSLAERGRATAPVSGDRSTASTDRAAGSVAFGGGVPLEPLLVQGNLGVAQTFGGFKIALSGAFGEYYDFSGYQVTGGLKLSYKFNKSWKLTGTFGISDDVELGSAPLLSPLGSLAVRFSW